MYTRVPPFLISLDVPQHCKPSNIYWSWLVTWMKHCTFQRLLATKRNLIVLYLILVWTVTDWGVLTVFTGSDMW